jgi:hypothetical protein
MSDHALGGNRRGLRVSEIGTWTRPLDGKIKAPPSGRRNWLVGLLFFGIRHEPPDGGSGTFLMIFNRPTAGDDVQVESITVLNTRAHNFCELCQVNPCAGVNLSSPSRLASPAFLHLSAGASSSARPAPRAPSEAKASRSGAAVGSRRWS